MQPNLYTKSSAIFGGKHYNKFQLFYLKVQNGLENQVKISVLA